MSPEMGGPRSNEISSLWTEERVESFQQVGNRHGVTVKVEACAGERYETQDVYRGIVPERKVYAILSREHNFDLGPFYADAAIELDLQDKSPLYKFYVRHIKKSL